MVLGGDPGAVVLGVRIPVGFFDWDVFVEVSDCELLRACSPDQLKGCVECVLVPASLGAGGAHAVALVWAGADRALRDPPPKVRLETRILRPGFLLYSDMIAIAVRTA